MMHKREERTRGIGGGGKRVEMGDRGLEQVSSDPIRYRGRNSAAGVAHDIRTG